MPTVRTVALAALLGLVAACTGAVSRTQVSGTAAPRMVLVAGASGRTGKFVIDELRERSLTFRPMTRSLTEATRRLGVGYEGLEWVEGDVREAVRMDQLMRGADTVISVIGTREVKGPNSAEFVDYGGVRNLVDAAVRQQVRHFVLLTAIGVTDPGHPLNKAAGNALLWRFRGEEYLRNSGLNYTIVRPAGLRDEPTGTWGLRLEQGDDWKRLKGAVVSRQDVAKVMVDALTEPRLRNVTIEVVSDPKLAPGDRRGGYASLVPDPARSVETR